MTRARSVTLDKVCRVALMNFACSSVALDPKEYVGNNLVAISDLS